MWKDTLVRSGRETWVRCAALVQHMDNHSYSVIHSRRKPGHSRVCEAVLWAKECHMPGSSTQGFRLLRPMLNVERWTLTKSIPACVRSCCLFCTKHTSLYMWSYEGSTVKWNYYQKVFAVAVMILSSILADQLRWFSFTSLRCSGIRRITRSVV